MCGPAAVLAQPQVGLVAKAPSWQLLTALLAPVSTTACSTAVDVRPESGLEEEVAQALSGVVWWAHADLCLPEGSRNGPVSPPQVNGR